MMTENMQCWPITNEEYANYSGISDNNPVQMTFNGYPINVDYIREINTIIMSVSDRLYDWRSMSRYYMCRGDSAPINALVYIFRKDPSLIYNSKKYTIAFVYSGDKDDVKNNFLHTPWHVINSRWEAIQLDLWSGDCRDEDITDAIRHSQGRG